MQATATSNSKLESDSGHQLSPTPPASSPLFSHAATSPPVSASASLASTPQVLQPQLQQLPAASATQVSDTPLALPPMAAPELPAHLVPPTPVYMSSAWLKSSSSKVLTREIEKVNEWRENKARELHLTLTRKDRMAKSGNLESLRTRLAALYKVDLHATPSSLPEPASLLGFNPMQVLEKEETIAINKKGWANLRMWGEKIQKAQAQGKSISLLGE